MSLLNSLQTHSTLDSNHLLYFGRLYIVYAKSIQIRLCIAQYNQGFRFPHAESMDTEHIRRKARNPDQNGQKY